MAKKTTKKSVNKNTTAKPKTRQTKTRQTIAKPTPTTENQPIKFIARPLCFTTSYNRPAHLYHCINNILNNQSYKDIKYVVGICIDDPIEQEDYDALLKDFLRDKRLSIFYHKNMDQHENYLYPIKKIDYHKHNLFIKIDDDDIYKSEYISNIIEQFTNNKTDVISSQIQYQINDNKLQQGPFDMVGEAWGPDRASKIKFGMPCTYAFNNKALDIILKLKVEDNHKIHPFEDPVWRTKWREKNISSYIIKESMDAIYNIHHSNVSSPQKINHMRDDTIYKNIENDFCSICLFKHHYWQSFVILNKRNNRMYNIDNDDHGEFEYLDDGNIKIIWDEWGEEIFHKRYIEHNYYYSIQ